MVAIVVVANQVVVVVVTHGLVIVQVIAVEVNLVQVKVNQVVVQAQVQTQSGLDIKKNNYNWKLVFGFEFLYYYLLDIKYIYPN